MSDAQCFELRPGVTGVMDSELYLYVSMQYHCGLGARLHHAAIAQREVRVLGNQSECRC